MNLTKSEIKILRDFTREDFLTDTFFKAKEEFENENLITINVDDYVEFSFACQIDLQRNFLESTKESILSVLNEMSEKVFDLDDIIQFQQVALRKYNLEFDAMTRGRDI